MYGFGNRSGRGFSPKLIIAALIALGSVVSYFGSRSTNEVTGEVQHVGSLSPEQEVAIGLNAAPQMAEQYGGLLQVPAIAAYVEQVGQGVVARSDARKSPYRFQFHVLADPKTINAFALPGGQVFITAGLLRRLQNEAQLAGVLGHEVGHVVARHGAEQLAKQQLTAGLVGAAGVASYDPQDPYRSARNTAMAAAVAQLVNMRFGREDELESDTLGVRFLKQGGYDPAGMTGLMKILAGASAGGRRPPEFFSTHPNPENRLQRLQQLIEQNGGPGGELGTQRFRDNVLGSLGALGVGGSGGE